MKIVHSKHEVSESTFLTQIECTPRWFITWIPKGYKNSSLIKDTMLRVILYNAQESQFNMQCRRPGFSVNIIQSNACRDDGCLHVCLSFGLPCLPVSAELARHRNDKEAKIWQLCPGVILYGRKKTLLVEDVLEYARIREIGFIYLLETYGGM